MHIVKHAARRVAGPALAVMLASGAAHAAEPMAAGVTRRSLVAAAVETVARLDVSRATEGETQAPASETANGRPFLKTRRGVVVAILMVAGTAWAIHSKYNDRVRSPAS